jgi:hypothetical protein
MITRRSVAYAVRTYDKHRRQHVPVVAVPRGWKQPADDRRPITVAIDGKHPSSSTLGYAFTEVSLRHVPLLVVQAAPLAELASGDQDTRLNLAEIHAGWKADYPDISLETFLLPGRPLDTVPSVSDDLQLLVVGVPTPAGNGHAGSVPPHAPHLIGPPGRSPSFSEHPWLQLVRTPARPRRIGQRVPASSLKRSAITSTRGDG